MANMRKQNVPRRDRLAQKLADRVLLDRRVADVLGRLGGLLARVHKDDDLVLASIVHHLFVTDLVRQLEALHRLLLGDANVLLLERARAEAGVRTARTRSGRLWLGMAQSARPEGARAHLLSKKKRPFDGSTRRNVATSW